MALGGFFEHPALGNLALALALGLLIGLQRGWAQRNEPAGQRFAGVRTYGLFGLAGGIAGWLFADARDLATVILATAAALILLSYYRMSERGGSISGTSSLTGLLTMASGFLAATGQRLEATAIAATIVALLAMRTQLHRLVGRLSEAEIAAIARFALIAFVILPLLPDRAYGPYDAWNPRQLWFVVVLVSGFSLVGYVAARLLGPSRGTIATAAAGSMVSSTAVTAALATRLKNEPESTRMLWSAISAASAVMYLRVMALTGMLAAFALPTLAVVAVPGLLISLGTTGWYLRRADGVSPTPAAPVTVHNPFSIGPALLLMVLVMVMTLAANWVLDRFGDAGLAVVLAISGSVDVDSAIITLGGLPAGTVAPRIAGLILLAPITLNTLFKAGSCVAIAGWRRGWPGAWPLVLSALASLAALPLLLG